MCINKNSLVTDHDGDVMAVWQRQGAIHVQDVVLCAQEALQVLRVRGHLLGYGVHATPADQSLHEQQRHSLLLTVHHHLQKPEQRREKVWFLTGKAKTSGWLLLQYNLMISLHCVHVYDGEAEVAGSETLS